MKYRVILLAFSGSCAVGIALIALLLPVQSHATAQNNCGKAESRREGCVQ